MKSLNFEVLRAKYPQLADYGGIAEALLHIDPASSIAKLRSLVEYIVAGFFVAKQLPRPYGSPDLASLLDQSAFITAVPPVLLNKMHFVRKHGNKAAHGAAFTAEVALDCLHAAKDLSDWFHLSLGGKQSDVTVFQAPLGPAPQMSDKQRAANAKKLEEQEQRMKELLASIEAERAKREELEQQQKLTVAELSELRVKGQAIADALKFDEARTRAALIDEQLADAGWSFDDHEDNHRRVAREVRVEPFAPNPSGQGFADYVLYAANGKPLAVIEAKRASIELEKGRAQAELYADGLETMTGQRPVILYTNGVDTMLWDDAQKHPPRRVFGFPSPDSLAWLVQQRSTRKSLRLVPSSAEIAGRMYQLEAIQRVCERFDDRHRRALIVQATGTGKTRVAISLCERLLRAGWARRILFLCDRKELRKQAFNAFKQFLPDEPRVIVDSGLSEEDRSKYRIFLGTYPAMMKCFDQFDVGFFDLVIADESHRSIYNRFRDLFLYFDALQVGLTATPVKFIDRNTYSLFGCDDANPTSSFTLKEAIEHQPPYLVAPQVVRVTTRFLREGIKYSQLSAAQRAKLEAEQEDADTIEHEAADIDRQIFNKDTNRKILRNLMEHGVRDKAGSRPGKTIVFARNHRHAVLLEELFNEMYPDLGGKFCRVIDNQEPQAEALIDQFKTPENSLSIAISVDMLDTGIDVPEVVNLVFARPVRSYVKFWQMIGRGTRLCPNLFGPGQDKTHFVIFDHWANFDYFEESYEEVDPSTSRSLLEQLFGARLDLAAEAMEKLDKPLFEQSIELVRRDLVALIESKSISVRERMAELLKMSAPAALEAFSGSTLHALRTVAAPLMQWRPLLGEEDAYRFDLLATELQCELLRGTARVADLRASVEASVELLLKNHAAVQGKAEAIARVRSKSFWESVSPAAVESLRAELRGVMKHTQETNAVRAAPRFVDIADDGELRVQQFPKLEGLELVAYRQRVQKVLDGHFAGDPVLVKIRRNEPVSEGDLASLCALVLQVDDKANIYQLAGHQPATREALLATLRGLVGLDAAAVEAAFTAFVHGHPMLSARQMRFLSLLQTHLATNGGIELDRLYEKPFTDVHADGLDGVFSDNEIDEIEQIVRQFPARSTAS